jgi:thiol-disulfide isomerase/thioredoxin
MPRFFPIMLFLFSLTPVFAQEEVQTFSTFDEFDQYLLTQKEAGTLVVNFWATWCKPCVEELPFFEELTKKYAEDPDVNVLLVSLDFPKQIQSRLLPFIEKHQLQSEVVALLDVKANSWIDRISPEWSGAIPATVFYQGEKNYFFEKTYHSFEELEEDLNRVRE